MPINITMPALSPTMEEGNLAKWLVKEGDQVSAGDVIAEIETDKATMEVEAVDEGTVGKIVVPEGTAGVKVNELIAVLLEDGEDAGSIDTAAASPAPAAAAAPAEAPAAAAPSAAASAPAGPAPVANDGSRIFASPLARRLAKLNSLGPFGSHRHRPAWPDCQARYRSRHFGRNRKSRPRSGSTKRRICCSGARCRGRRRIRS